MHPEAPGSAVHNFFKDGCENDGIVVCCGLYWFTIVVYYDPPSDKIGCGCYSGQSSKDRLYALRVVHVGKIGQHLRFVHGYNMYIYIYSMYRGCKSIGFNEISSLNQEFLTNRKKTTEEAGTQV